MRYKNLVFSITAVIAFTALFLSCSNDNTHEEEEKDMKLNFFIKTNTKSDVLVMGGDGSFSSLAVYVYNKDDGYCEYSELIPVFTPNAVEEYSRSVNVSSKTKIIYAIANYNDSDKTFSIPVTADMSMQELESLIIDNKDFSDASILMVGKKEVIMDSELVTAEVPMQRMAARLDIYMFKSREIESSEVFVKSVEFNNQILNTNGKFQSLAMAQPVNKRTISEDITANQELNVVPYTVSGVLPEDLHKTFYTYQNISISAKPDKEINPYLRITASVNGVDQVYIGYLQSYTQPEGNFSLVRNKVYNVVAILGGVDNSIILDMSVFPWNVTESEIGHNVNDSDIVFDAWGNDSEALRGIVQYPYIDSKGQQNKTSFANYSFTLPAPPGALWTATLTNGLDFTFGKGGTTPGKNAVSQGITRNEPYEIKVGATKPWGGEVRSTYMYITVNGEKLKINPVLGDGKRKFPGDNDTDILILQTEYQN